MRIPAIIRRHNLASTNHSQRPSPEKVRLILLPDLRHVSTSSRPHWRQFSRTSTSACDQLPRLSNISPSVSTSFTSVRQISHHPTNSHSPTATLQQPLFPPISTFVHFLSPIFDSDWKPIAVLHVFYSCQASFHSIFNLALSGRD